MTIKQLVVTKPLSLKGPSDADLLRTQELNKFLVDVGLYESHEEAVKREEVLGRIKKIVVDWVKQVTRVRGYTDQMVEDANVVIFTFGSYRIGVHGPGADIDTLCVGTSYVHRDEDFFIVLHNILARMDEVSELHSIPNAHVPVMKFKFDGIYVKLLYASVFLLVVPDDIDIFDVSVLKNVDGPTVRSLNNCRVADQILKLVPNVEVTGFLGGVSWTLLVAQICQLYPNAIPSMLVSRFFKVYTQWRWPNPVLLCEIEDKGFGYVVWDPRKYPKNRTDLMPIVTPAYPCVNSSYNVSTSTLYVMTEQFPFGNRICETLTLRLKVLFVFQEIELTNPSGLPCLNLICSESYKNYLQVDIIAANNDDLHAWRGWVESRLRQLTILIERDTLGKLQCHPYPHEYSDPLKQCSHSTFFIGLQRKQGNIILEGRQFDIRRTIDEFRHKKKYLGNRVSVSHVRKKHIPLYVFQDGHKRSRLPKLINQPTFDKATHDNGAKYNTERDMDDVVEKTKGIHLEASKSSDVS